VPVLLGLALRLAMASQAFTSAIKQAAALRMKYRVADDASALADNKRHIHASMIGQHPGNRHGIAVNGSRCDELLAHIFEHFDEEEASHGAVAVQEIPQKTIILDYNKKSGRGSFASFCHGREHALRQHRQFARQSSLA